MEWRDTLEVLGAMVGFFMLVVGSAVLWPPLTVIVLFAFTLLVVAGACSA